MNINLHYNQRANTILDFINLSEKDLKNSDVFDVSSLKIVRFFVGIEFKKTRRTASRLSLCPLYFQRASNHRLTFIKYIFSNHHNYEKTAQVSNVGFLYEL